MNKQKCHMTMTRSIAMTKTLSSSSTTESITNSLTLHGNQLLVNVVSFKCLIVQSSHVCSCQNSFLCRHNTPRLSSTAVKNLFSLAGRWSHLEKNMT